MSGTLFNTGLGLRWVPTPPTPAHGRSPPPLGQEVSPPLPHKPHPIPNRPQLPQQQSYSSAQSPDENTGAINKPTVGGDLLDYEENYDRKIQTSNIFRRSLFSKVNQNDDDNTKNRQDILRNYSMDNFRGNSTSYIDRKNNERTEFENHETIDGAHYASFFVSSESVHREGPFLSFRENAAQDTYPSFSSRDSNSHEPSRDNGSPVPARHVNSVHGIRQHFSVQGGPLHYQYTLSHVTMRWSGSQVGSEHSLQDRFFPAEVRYHVHVKLKYLSYGPLILNSFYIHVYTIRLNFINIIMDK